MVVELLAMKHLGRNVVEDGGVRRRGLGGPGSHASPYDDLGSDVHPAGHTSECGECGEVQATFTMTSSSCENSLSGASPSPTKTEPQTTKYCVFNSQRK